MSSDQYRYIEKILSKISNEGIGLPSWAHDLMLMIVSNKPDPNKEHVIILDCLTFYRSLMDKILLTDEMRTWICSDIPRLILSIYDNDPLIVMEILEIFVIDTDKLLPIKLILEATRYYSAIKPFAIDYLKWNLGIFVRP